MKKQVLVISTSLRKHSNSQAMAQAFLEGAQQAGHDVQLVSLAGKKLDFCTGCLACQKTHRCVLEDDARQIVEQMAQADVLVFATPIYYYEMTGQMKTLLDRANPLYGTGPAFREVYLLTCAADEDPQTPNAAISGLEGWIACFDGVRLAGTVFAGGVDAPGAIAGHPALDQARQAGAQV